jgi:hypothetical protein
MSSNLVLLGRILANAAAMVSMPKIAQTFILGNNMFSLLQQVKARADWILETKI